ncbi:MAG TPA: hypothetical protein VFY20_04495 [Gemmatimonadales bacterium]|nr:hypothetical protein [Gemmatimonadales bacterium]
MSGDLVYRIDSSDRLCYVNEAWEAFARANSGEAFDAEHVLGRSIWSYVSDLTLGQIYRHVVEDVRRGREVRLRFRCDAPTERRLLEMTVRGAGRGVVQFRTHELATVPRPPEALLDASTSRVGTPVPVCSWCNRVRAVDGWLEVEQAVEHMHLMLRSVLPPLTHGACDSCLDTIAHGLDAFVRPRHPLHSSPLLFSLGDNPAAVTLG